MLGQQLHVCGDHEKAALTGADESGSYLTCWLYGVMVNTPEATALEVQPPPVAMALMVVVAETAIGPVYFVEEVLGVAPLVV